jgi:hypothetical protein
VRAATTAAATIESARQFAKHRTASSRPTVSALSRLKRIFVVDVELEELLEHTALSLGFTRVSIVQASITTLE